MDMNATTITGGLPPLPSYTVSPLEPLVAGINDKYLMLMCPIIAYWVVSVFFHIIDELDLFPQYRLHTPAEITQRNHATRYEVFRDVLLQHFIQTLAGIVTGYFDPDPITGMDDYYLTAWAQRIRIAQRAIPVVLGAVGFDAAGLSQKAFQYHPDLASALKGGEYAYFAKSVGQAAVPAFATWELQAAYAIYWYIFPAFQFFAAICIVDTWQYWIHRTLHMNKWLYNTIHSRHHRLYVPYAYGALYNHPLEGFLVDTLGAGIAYLATGMTYRQGMWFFAGSTIKTVDDHCGYALPFDPLQHITGNNAGYHDVHHQSWGIKTNFSQPFFTFWDHLLGTAWVGGDVTGRYERAKIAAQKKFDQENAKKDISGSKGIDSVLADSKAPYTSGASAKLNSSSIQPQPPAGKATAQANDSRRQVLDDKSSAGGPSVIVEETAEELKAANLRSVKV